MKEAWERKRLDSQKLKAGMGKLRQALVDDEKTRRQKPSALPKNWNGRVIR